MKIKTMSWKSLTIIFLVIINNALNCYGQVSCTVTNSGLLGTCTNLADCSVVLQDIRIGKRDYTLCEYKNPIVYVCCPNPIKVIAPEKTVQLDVKVEKNDTQDDLSTYRISIQKCHEYAESVFQTIHSFGLRGGPQLPDQKKDVCGFKTVPLIVGGTKADPTEFPHMALVGYENGTEKFWGCGGTLISNNYVLTAAHCIYSRLGYPKYVRLGELNVASEDDDADPIDFNVTQLIPHPSYKRLSKYNDIALLKLDGIVEFSAYIRPACLPREHENSATTKVIATGWGNTEWVGAKAEHLQKVILEKFSESDCNGVYGQQFDSKLRNGIQYDTQICAGSKNEKKDTCQGDSGGPIQAYASSEYCMYEIVGVTSFGIMCGTPNIPGVYTRVYPYVEWIEKTVWD